MKRSRMSARKNYRHYLAAGMSEYLPACVFSAFARISGQRWVARMLAFTAILMSWGESATLGSQFIGARQSVRTMFPRHLAVGKTYQGFIRALLAIQDRLLEAVIVHLRGAVRQIADHRGMSEGMEAFAVDGSRIECPRTKANEAAFGHAGKKGCGPQMWLTTLWHMGTGLPWGWKQGPSYACERHHLRDMLPLLPDGALVVGDAGFVGYEHFTDILSAGKNFLTRVGGNVQLLRELGWVKLYGQDTIFLWPQNHRKNEPLILRLIVLERAGKKIYLLTNLTAESLSNRQAAAFYTMRWGVEVFYRSLKQTLEHRTMRSCAPAQARAELAWSLVGLLLMGLMSVGEMIDRGIDPLEWSVAASRDLIRQAVGWPSGRPLSHRGWKNRLAACRKDRYVRTGGKTSRQWPDRKQQRPPGPPKIRDASEKELMQAQKLLKKSQAA